MLNNDTLKNHAVSIVERHLNKAAALDDAIADVAKQEKMNDHEIKRLVEASNQLTYLKLHSLNKDKTFEFPLASYDGVKGNLTAAPHIEKAASASMGLPFPLGEIEKQASYKEAEVSQAEKEYVTFRMQHEIPRMQEELLVKRAELQVEAMRAFREDSELLTKLAWLNGDEEVKKTHRFFEHELEKASRLLEEKRVVAEAEQDLQKASSLVGGAVRGVGRMGVGIAKSLVKKGPEGTGISALGNAALMGLGVKPGVDAANNVGKMIGVG
jgi:hypothetical protein